MNDERQFLSAGLKHPASDVVWPWSLAQFALAELPPHILLSEGGWVFWEEWLECFQPSLTVG